jgi:RHH-type proline utilization regulon transcriptional repressor/proline dehydrogenase/delta 1-pyrroline-5-carboxylate dehydrogenase
MARPVWEAKTTEDRPLAPVAPGREQIATSHLADEMRLVGGLIERAVYTEDERRRIADLAQRLVSTARAKADANGIDAFMHEYGLSSDEGVILMCLAEALLRIPDRETTDALITDKIGGGRWETHLGASDSLFVNASTFGLMLTGRLVRLGEGGNGGPTGVLKRLVARSGEPVIRQALRRAMRLLGDNFVLGTTIRQALDRAAPLERAGYRFSHDMLGEAARTKADAQRYMNRYIEALETIGRAAGPGASSNIDVLMARPGLSVKLSAIDARFETTKAARLKTELVPKVVELARRARDLGLSLTIDAEEQDRLDLTLGIFSDVFLDPKLAGYPGLGLAVQAYGKRAVPVLRWLRRLSEFAGKRIPVRLVKGAYWDSEIKWAQERGLADYPVFTQKTHTDVSYLACARLLLSDPRAFYPQFATHNAHTAAAVHVAAGNTDFEFQRLHGMGEALHAALTDTQTLARACRIYAPVGGHEDLLPYLVRRLLENGANSSFVNRLADDALPIEDITRDPIATAEAQRNGLEALPPRLPRPPEIFLPERTNSRGLALAEPHVRDEFQARVVKELETSFAVGPIIDGQPIAGSSAAQLVLCPHDRRQRIGTVETTDAAIVEHAMASATAAQYAWNRLGGPARAAILDRAADLYENDRARLVAVIVREAGKTLETALGDVREAVDFLRYYAALARRQFAAPIVLPGVTGEHNTLTLAGRGTFVCISPWNFPLAIFTGQVAAALAAGNSVVAKPAEQTPIVAFLAVQHLIEAGVPAGALHLVTGGGSVGAALVRDLRTTGVAFTGSNATANAIQKTLIERGGPIIPFIAETGGMNAMIADSSALAEQVVRDAVRSAFDSAGQRCSAARVLFLQNEIADRTIEMLVGAIETLEIGDPLDETTDVGPVIDEQAQDTLDAHKMHMVRTAKRLVDLPLPPEREVGTYVTPAAFEIDGLSSLSGEVFGPILHVVRYDRARFDAVIDAINGTGYGLTLALHSRIARVADQVAARARVGNLYVNRNQIGAVVGSQPFGGEGLSGTGPKAGGPNYLLRFATERVRSTDVTATGGNVALLGLGQKAAPGKR